MTAEAILPCAHHWPRPFLPGSPGRAPKAQEPWSCNRPSGHAGAHRVIDPRTFAVLAEVGA